MRCSGANGTDHVTIENFCAKNSSEKDKIAKRPTPARLGTCTCLSSDRVRIGQVISSALGRKVTTHAR